MVQQLTLDIPQVDTKATRKALYAYLAVYRRYKQQLADDWTPTPRAPLPGYENAANPDLIRRPGFNPHAEPGMTPEEYRAHFIQRVNAKVEKLPPYGREIIRRRLLTPVKGHQSIHDLPSDTEVLEAMKRDGWYGEKRYFDDQKAEAIQMLAESLNIAVYLARNGCESFAIRG